MTTAKSKTPKNAPNASAPAKKSVKERRAEAIRRRQRQQVVLLAIIAAAALIVIGGFLIISSRPVDAQIAESILDKYTEITAKGYYGSTPEGFYFIGNPEAKVTMEMFSSFSCPACQQYKRNYFDNIRDKILNGDVKFVYIPLTQYGSFPSEGMARAAICAGEQGKFWEMHDALFDWAGRYGSAANDGRYGISGAEKLGLDTSKFSNCLGDARTGEIVRNAANLAAERGVNATPTVFLNGTKIYPERQGGGAAPNLSELRGLIEATVAN
jgi:protein-disulfide isomerase